MIHQLGVKPALDLADEAIDDFQADLVLYIAAVGQHDDIAGPDDDRAIGRAFIREGVHMAAAPVVEMAGIVRISPLGHDRILAA